MFIGLLNRLSEINKFRDCNNRGQSFFASTSPKVRHSAEGLETNQLVGFVWAVKGMTHSPRRFGRSVAGGHVDCKVASLLPLATSLTAVVSPRRGSDGSPIAGSSELTCLLSAVEWPARVPCVPAQPGPQHDLDPRGTPVPPGGLAGATGETTLFGPGVPRAVPVGPSCQTSGH